MRRLFPLVLLLLLVAPGRAWGHPMPSSLVELRLHRSAIDAELTLPVSELALGWDKPLPRDADRAASEYGAALKEYIRAHVRPVAPDGRPWSVAVREVTPVAEQNPDLRVSLTMTPPPGAPVDRLNLRYDVIFHRLITHTAIVSLANDWNSGVVGDHPVLLGTLRDTQPSLVIDRSGGSWFQGFAATFRLGVRHIAEGTDHLLFLLALILTAPLTVRAGRWAETAGIKKSVARLLKIVSAFTLGHSLTLVAGAIGWVHVPQQPIEVLIALSIFVSAIHALKPCFPGREAVIAAGFGLIHGLSFAAVIADFGLDPLHTVLSIFGFNLGIEGMQLFVVAATVPWLLLLARASTATYTPVRVLGGVAAAIASVGWLAERTFRWSNPIGTMVETIAHHIFWLLLALAIYSSAAFLWQRLRRHRLTGEGLLAGGLVEAS